MAAAAILAIDPAWTPGQPSGVALLRESDAGWQCVALAPSYEEFEALAAGTPVDWRDPPRRRPTSLPDPVALLRASRVLLGRGAKIRVVTVDMPLATGPIVQRREADNAVSRSLAGFGLGAHSPSPTRPGPLADAMRRGFGRSGFAVGTTATAAGTPGRMLEVFPHAALLALLGDRYRVRYKASRARQYWPDLDPAQRTASLLREWRRIRAALRRRIAGIELPMPQPAVGRRMKRFEDALDALTCGWMGMEYLARRVRALGDDTAAVWIPEPLPSPAGQSLHTRRKPV